MLYVFVEGVHITTTVSTQVDGMICSWYIPDIMDYTIDVNKYNLDLSGITSLVFELKTCGRAHILMSSSDVRNSAEPMYEIDIGFDTHKTYIIHRADDSLDSGSRMFSKFLTSNIFNCSVYLPLWISWADGDIKLGTGSVVDENVLEYLTSAPQFEVKAIGVLTDYGMLGSLKIQFEDNFIGYFDSCSMDNTKSDMVVVDDIKCSKSVCVVSCVMSRTCMGINFNTAMTSCELLSFGSDVVTDIPFHIEAGWRFYSKCFNVETACLGCYFDNR
ncbi:unnamed protein product [Mytilus edulis]|uniref:Farnesoic acid O-methyl transferase domain-containing protein n=1 Tax=Mytilus edulis TaxID=6550 RepID=A0A8S3V9T1_MYTED|nr:unnamed protein product [Mytilus edulis]